MTQIALTSPAAVTILLERSKIFTATPGISSYVTVAIPAESVAATVSAETDFGPYLADREVTLNLFLGTVVYEVKDSAGGGSVSAAAISSALDAATPAELAAIQSSVSGYLRPSLRRMFSHGSRIGLCGDSVTYTNTSIGVANTLSYWDNGYFGWASAYLGLSPSVVINGGVGGEPTGLFFDQLDSMLAAGVDGVFFLGGINNSDGVDMVRLIMADYEEAYRRTVAAGAFFFALTPPAKSADTSAKKARYLALAGKIKDRFGNRQDSHVADTRAAVYDDVAATWKTGYSYDGTHPTSLGGIAFGSAIGDAVLAYGVAKQSNPWLSAGVDDVRSVDAGSSQRLVNPMLTGTTGTKGTGCTGELASSWQAVCVGSVTAALSKVAAADGLGEWQVCTLTATAGGAEFQLYQAFGAGAFTAGDKIFGAAEIVVDATPSGLENVKFEISHSPLQKAAWGAKTGNTTAAFDRGFSVTAHTRPDVVVLGTTTGAGQVTLSCVFKTAGSAVVRMRRPALRTVAS